MAKTARKPLRRARASITDWLGRVIKPTNGRFWSMWGGAKNHTGQVVNERTVLTLSAAWACTRLISETLATLPLKVYQRTSTGQVEARDFPLYNILTQVPNSDTTATIHWEATVASMLLRGGAWWERQVANGRLVGVVFLDPCRLTWTRIRPGHFRYLYKDPKTDIQREIPESRIVYLPGFSLDGLCGVSVIAYGANVFGNALAADAAAGRTFKNGLLPTTYIKTERVLQKSQREKVRDFTEKVSGALNSGKPFVLEAGMTMGSVGIDPKDAQLLETRGYSANEVCSWFRVPPWMVGVQANGQTKWGSGLEQELIGFLTFTLRPWMTRIAQSVMKDLLTPTQRLDYFVRYDVQDLLFADSAARSAFYSAMITNGVMTPDEAREREGLPLKGGAADELWIQGAMKALNAAPEETGEGTSAARAKYAKIASELADLLMVGDKDDGEATR